MIVVQKGFGDPQWGKRNNPNTEDNIAKLIAAWRMSRRPIFHVMLTSKVPGSPLRPGQLGNEFKESVAPESGAPVVMKDANSAFIGTDSPGGAPAS